MILGIALVIGTHPALGHPMESSSEPVRFRVEHRTPKGRVRVLAFSGLGSIAGAAAVTWQSAFRRRGERGAIVVVDQRTGRVVRTVLLDPD